MTEKRGIMKSIFIAGLGRFGKHMAIKFTEQGHDVLAVDNNEERVNDALPFVTNAQIGDTTNEQFMMSLGINNFDLCVVAIGDNFQSSLETAALLKDLGAKYILARAKSDVHKKFLQRTGANEVVYTERETAESLAVMHGSDSIFDYIELTPEYSIYEISVPKSWIGKTIIGKNVRAKHHINILATKENGRIKPLPRPDHIFKSEETLLVMGHNEDIEKIVK